MILALWVLSNLILHNKQALSHFWGKIVLFCFVLFFVQQVSANIWSLLSACVGSFIQDRNSVPRLYLDRAHRDDFHLTAVRLFFSHSLSRNDGRINFVSVVISVTAEQKGEDYPAISANISDTSSLSSASSAAIQSDR